MIIPVEVIKLPVMLQSLHCLLIKEVKYPVVYYYNVSIFG